MKTIRVGNGCGFWGDNLDAPVRLTEPGGLDYLTLEYLAELTMSILALQKQRDPQAGFARDFLDVLERLAPLWKAQPGLKIITNAGGMNPEGCARLARSVLDRAGLSERAIATVEGDDLLPDLDPLLTAGHTLAHLDTGEPLATIRECVVSANAYLGAGPIAAALKLPGVALVITGRVAD
ncbi:MAG: acyclic terpene utilization AtuA family protein, partial [Planctomycetes bacterium]|nr:acyclic terpene utilization AtuA family protein [Planctomycetota bacterium]